MTPTRFADLRTLIPPGHRHLLAVFDALPPDARERLAAGARVVQVPQGHLLVREGCETTEVGYVLDGTLGMIKVLPDERRHIIGLLMPTDMYGRLFDGPHGYRIEALAPARLLQFDRCAFEAILAEAPEIERMFLVSVLDELDATREWVLLLNGTRVIERVASFLLLLARRDCPGEAPGVPAAAPVPVRLPIRRPDLARCLGIRPESLSRALHRLARDGIIAIGEADRFGIRDMAELVRVAGQDPVVEAPAGAKPRP